MTRVQFLAGAGKGFFLSATSSRPALGPTQPPVQWVLEALSPGIKLTTHLNIVPRLRICGAVPPFSHVFMAWCLVKHRDNFTFNFGSWFKVWYIDHFTLDLASEPVN
jgi:hypothetical protein